MIRSRLSCFSVAGSPFRLHHPTIPFPVIGGFCSSHPKTWPLLRARQITSSLLNTGASLYWSREIIYRFGWLNEFANSFSWRLSVECEMRAIFVVFGFPSLQLSGKIPFMFEMPSLVELLRIRFMAPFDLPIHLGATWRYVFMRDAEIGKMPSELRSERRAVIGLDFLNREGEMLLDLPEEVDRSLGVVVVVDAEHPKSGRFVNGGELIKTLTRSSYTGNELHIQLDRAARDLQRRIRWFWAGTIFLSRHRANVMTVKDLQDSRRRHVSVVVPLKIEADSNGALTTLFPNAKDQRQIPGWDTKADLVWFPGQVPETSYPVLLITFFPDAIECPGNSKKPAGLADVAADALRMLQHAQPSLHLPCLDLFVGWILHPEPPAVGCENTPPVRDVY